VDIVQPDTCAAGGLTECKKIADLAGAFGVRYNPHVWGTGIAIAASLQLLGRCANTYADLACASRADTGVRPDGAPNSSSRSDAAAQHVGGIVRVPEGPGLGIEVNREALSSLTAP
jgi:D-galactarolactone cycloisomerase